MKTPVTLTPAIGEIAVGKNIEKFKENGVKIIVET